jgi:hypothetical protein
MNPPQDPKDVMRHGHAAGVPVVLISKDFRRLDNLRDWIALKRKRYGRIFPCKRVIDGRHVFAAAQNFNSNNPMHVEMFHSSRELPKNERFFAFVHEKMVIDDSYVCEPQAIRPRKPRIRPPAQEKSATPRRNAFGYRGVVRGPKCVCYGASVSAGGVRVRTGCIYPTPEDAAHAYDELAKKHHGERARLNFPPG